MVAAGYLGPRAPLAHWAHCTEWLMSKFVRLQSRAAYREAGLPEPALEQIRVWVIGARGCQPDQCVSLVGQLDARRPTAFRIVVISVDNHCPLARSELKDILRSMGIRPINADSSRWISKTVLDGLLAKLRYLQRPGRTEPTIELDGVRVSVVDSEAAINDIAPDRLKSQ